MNPFRTSQPSSVVTPIPALIQRNMWFIAAAQVAVGTANQLIPALGALMTVRLSGSAGLAGAASSTLGLGRMLIAYAIGTITDHFGRKAGLFIGIVLSLIGSMLTGLSLVFSDLGLFFIGILVFAFGSGAIGQLRVAATDMYPPSRRAEGLGFLLTASTIGAFGGLGLVLVAEAFANSVSVDPMALTWFLTPLVFLPAALFISRVRPDPLQISANLARYYPGYEAPEHRPMGRSESPTGFRTFLRDYPTRTAFVSYFAVQGNMSMMMAITALVLRAHGYGLPAISLTAAIHSAAMFGPSLPLGAFSDRIGRRWVMMFGVLTAAFGSLLIVSSATYVLITAGLLLVGLGWAGVNVAATALIVDRTSPLERGRAIGANDTFGGAASIFTPLVAGPLAATLGLSVVGIFAMSLMILPAVLLVRLIEPSPGQYAVALPAETPA